MVLEKVLGYWIALAVLMSIAGWANAAQNAAVVTIGAFFGIDVLLPYLSQSK